MGGKKKRGGGAAAAAGGGTSEAAGTTSQAPPSSPYTAYNRAKPSPAVTFSTVTPVREAPSFSAAQSQQGTGWDALHDPAAGWGDSTPAAKLFNVASPRRELTQAWISQHPPNPPQASTAWAPPHADFAFGDGSGNDSGSALGLAEVSSNPGSFSEHARMEIPSSSPEPEEPSPATTPPPPVVHEPVKEAEQEHVTTGPIDTAQPEEESDEQVIIPKDMRDVTTLFIAALPSITQMDTTELHARLLNHMSRYAPIYELRVKAGATAPFAFAAYANPRLAAQGSKAHHSTFEGRLIRIELAGLERHIDVECMGAVDHKELSRLISRRVRSTNQLPPILRPTSSVGKVNITEKTLVHVARLFGSAFVLSRDSSRGTQSWTLEFDTHAAAGEFLFCLNELPETEPLHICFTRTYQQRQSFGRSYYPNQSHYASKYYATQPSPVVAQQQQQQQQQVQQQQQWPVHSPIYATSAPHTDGSADQRVEETPTSSPATPWLESDTSLNTATASTSGVSTPQQGFGSPVQVASPYGHAPVITSGAANNAWAPYYQPAPMKLERTIDPNGIWIGVFPPQMEPQLEAMLRPIFEAHGSITDFKAVMAYYQRPHPRAMAFVQFETPEAAASALSESGRLLDNGVTMHVKPRERRRNIPLHMPQAPVPFVAPAPVMPAPMMERLSPDATAASGDAGFMGMQDVAEALPTPTVEEGSVLGLSRFDPCAPQSDWHSEGTLEERQEPASSEGTTITNVPAMPDFGESPTPKPIIGESTETQSPCASPSQTTQAVSQSIAAAQAQVTTRQQQQSRGRGGFKRRFTPPHTQGRGTPAGDRPRVSRAGQSTPSGSLPSSAGLPPTPQFRGVSGSSAAWPGSLRAMAPGMYQARPPSLVSHPSYMNVPQPSGGGTMAAPPLIVPMMVPTMQAPLAGAPLHFMHNVNASVPPTSGGPMATTAPSRPHSLPSPAVTPWHPHAVQPTPLAFEQAQQVQPQPHVAAYPPSHSYQPNAMQPQQQPQQQPGFMPRPPPQPVQMASHPYTTPLYTAPAVAQPQPQQQPSQQAGTAYQGIPEMPAAAPLALNDPNAAAAARYVRTASPRPQLYALPNDIPAWASDD